MQLTTGKKTMLEEIGRLNEELRRLRGGLEEREFELQEMRCQVDPGAKPVAVHRMPGLDRLKIIYESDPNKDQRIKHLGEELELAIVRLRLQCSSTGRMLGSGFRTKRP